MCDSFQRERRTWLVKFERESALMLERYQGMTMAEYDRQRDRILAQQTLDNEAERHENAIRRGRLQKYRKGPMPAKTLIPRRKRA